MSNGFSRGLLRLLRVPPEPRLPAGEPGSARVFRAAESYWKLKLLGWSARQAVTLAGFGFFIYFMHTVPETLTITDKRAPGKVQHISIARPIAVIRALEGLVWMAWLVQVPITFALLRLDYELRWYIVTDRAARLREGIVNLKEMTFTLANVQDIRIGQGPLQRLLGLADVELRTAGGREAPPGRTAHGAAGENLHLARFRGVSNAEAIRDLVADRMKRARGAGLGDPDDAPRAERPHPAGELAAAAQALAEESSRLRAAVARVAGA